MAARTPGVLVAGDHADSLAMYALGLLAMGFQPTTASSADGAFDRACESRPDAVVISSTQGPGFVVDLCRRLRCEPQTAGIAILAISGAGLPSSRDIFDEAGCDGVVAWPCRLEVLAQEIREALARRECTAARKRRHTKPGRETSSPAKPCPVCAGALVFRPRHPVLMLTPRTGFTVTLNARIRYERAWVCATATCGYREVAEPDAVSLAADGRASSGDRIHQ